MQYLIFGLLFYAMPFSARAGEFNFFNRNLSGGGISINTDGKAITDPSWKITSEKEDLLVYTNVERPSEDPFGLIKQTVGVFKKGGKIERLATAGSSGGSMSGFKDSKMVWNINCTHKCTVTSKNICNFYARKLNAKNWEEAKRELDKCEGLSADFPEDINREYVDLLKNYSLDIQKIRNRLGQLSGKVGIGVVTPNYQQENAQIYAIAKAIEECSQMPYGAIRSDAKDNEKATTIK